MMAAQQQSTPCSTEEDKLLVDLYQKHDVMWKVHHPNYRRPPREGTEVNMRGSSRGAHLTKPGWSKPHTHSNPTNLALFRHKIKLYRFNQGGHTIVGVSNGSRVGGR